jgi:hypothetical protein
MAEEKQQTTLNENESVIKSNAQDALYQTAIKTFCACLVVCALIAVIITLLFPLSSMRFYDDLGLTARAYACADRAARVEKGADEVTAKLYKVNLSAKLFEEKGTSYADELYASSKDFLSDSECLKRAVKVDEYNLASSSKAIRPNLYSYRTYVSELYTRAAFRLGETEEIAALMDKFASTSVSQKAELFYQIAAVYYEASVMGKSVTIFAEEKLTAEASKYFNEVTATLTDEPTLEQLYLLKAYEKFSARFAPSSEVNKLVTVYQGQTVNASEFYQTQLIKYCN